MESLTPFTGAQMAQLQSLTINRKHPGNYTVDGSEAELRR